MPDFSNLTPHCTFGAEFETIRRRVARPAGNLRRRSKMQTKCVICPGVPAAFTMGLGDRCFASHATGREIVRTVLPERVSAREDASENFTPTRTTAENFRPTIHAAAISADRSPSMTISEQKKKRRHTSVYRPRLKISLQKPQITVSYSAPFRPDRRRHRSPRPSSRRACFRGPSSSEAARDDTYRRTHPRALP